MKEHTQIQWPARNALSIAYAGGPENKVEPQSYEDILKVYRDYLHDPKAEFSPEIEEELKRQGKIRKDEGKN